MVNRVLIKGGLKRKEFVKVDDGVIGESGLEWLAMINESTGAPRHRKLRKFILPARFPSRYKRFTSIARRLLRPVSSERRVS